MDKIEIIGLTLKTKIGVHPWEQSIDQRLVIDIHIETDFASISDNIEETIDYDKLCTMLTNHLEQTSYKLIETVANKLAELIKASFKLDSVTVVVSKPNAIANATNVRVVAKR